jgi:hypothetical protein
VRSAAFTLSTRVAAPRGSVLAFRPWFVMLTLPGVRL